MEIIKNLRYKISNIYVMVWRSFIHSVRTADIIVTSTILPTIILLILVGLMGGAIDTGNVEYIDFVLPGMILLCIGYGASMNAVSITSDIKKGIIDRFSSMPISKTSFLTGHVIASVFRNFISIILIIIVAFLIGFSTKAGIREWIFICFMIFLYSLALTWVSVVIGIIAGTPESAQAFSFILMFLPYFSSAFVPTDNMAIGLKFFAENQPLNSIILTIRALFMNESPGNIAYIAILWSLGIILVFYITAYYLFNKKTA